MTFNKDILRDQVAIVTGGGTGIGAGISRQLAAHGASIVILSRNPDNHTEVLSDLSKAGTRALSLSADVRDTETVTEAVERAREEFGRIDILVNNAAGNFLCPAKDLSPNGWKSVVDIVLNGTFHLSKAVFPAMRSQGAGSIVNIGAAYAWMAAPFVGHSGAAKAGVLSLTRTLAVEWGGYGLRVNAVTPGPIEGTEGVKRLVRHREALLAKIPAGRLGQAHEIGSAVVFLCSQSAAYINGHNLVVDGGLWLGQSAHLGPSDGEG